MLKQFENRQFYLQSTSVDRNFEN